MIGHNWIALHPERYHGQGQRPPFFEGWYYKLVDTSGQHRYAIIPGIFLSDDPTEQHAFVQVLDGVSGQATYHRYPIDEFEATGDALDIRVGPNHFTWEALSLQIDTPKLQLAGHVEFKDITPWPVTILSPGIMGWYGWLPFLECYHGVLSLDHTLQGSLVSRDDRGAVRIDFEKGRGYIEKDWGKSFPSAWIWMQTNHFTDPGTCLTASIATIPWGRRAFRGFIVGLWHQGQLHRFTTYTGARVRRLTVGDETIQWTLENQHKRLELCAHRAEGGPLKGPSRQDMSIRVPESLSATIAVRLLERQSTGLVPLFEDRGRYGGLEIVGVIDRLLEP